MRLAALELPARFAGVAQQLALVDELLAAPTDLALLPEASLTGYVSPQGDFDLARFAEPRDGPTARALADLAKRHRTRLVGPLVERAGNCLYNAMIGFDADGREFLHYRKRHPWYPETWATPGDAPHPVVEVEGLRVTIALCFDIQFASELPPHDVLLFPSAWVEKRDTRPALLRALGTHVVNANWGVGEPRVAGQGNSCILHASGEVLARGGPRLDAVLTASTDRADRKSRPQ
ncbi:MAG TPA: carbon-nitrogen hydrolase family protein [Polyangiaceae bacterium]|jgi:predicted amidohydrolase